VHTSSSSAAAAAILEHTLLAFDLALGLARRCQRRVPRLAQQVNRPSGRGIEGILLRVVVDVALPSANSTASSSDLGVTLIGYGAGGVIAMRIGAVGRRRAG
jgi:hypothetical protein